MFISMSAIDFYCSVDKVQGVDGKDRVVITFDGKYLPYTEQVSLPLIFSMKRVNNRIASLVCVNFSWIIILILPILQLT